MNPWTKPNKQSIVSIHLFCLILQIITKSTRIECFENSPEELLVFGNGVHVIDGAKEQGQRRGFVFAKLIDYLFESLKIP